MPVNNVIELDEWEMLLAAHAGIMRQVENLKRNRTPHYGAKNTNDWQLHIEGCMGEFALAKFLNIRWSGKGRLRAPDVGDVDVRTRSRDFYELILHPNDPDDRVFWLLCGVNGRYTVKGWIRGRDGKKQEFWKDPAKGRPAFFVPHSALSLPSIDVKQTPLSASALLPVRLDTPLPPTAPIQTPPVETGLKITKPLWE